MRTSAWPLVLLSASLFTAAGLAHDTWIAPDAFRTARRTAITVSLTSGMEFPKLDHPIQPDRVAEARLRTSARKVIDLSGASVSANALLFRQALSTPGVTLFWVRLHPRPSELQPQQVREYVDHLGLGDPEAVVKQWGGGVVRYRYTKFAKTFVRVGKGSGGAWSEPAGLRLELMPLSDPTAARAGGTIAFRLLADGRPLKRYPVTVTHEGSTESKSARTDETGSIEIDLPASGRYMVKAATLEASRESGFDWDVDFTTATLEVSGRKQR